MISRYCIGNIRSDKSLIKYPNVVLRYCIHIYIGYSVNGVIILIITSYRYINNE